MRVTLATLAAMFLCIVVLKAKTKKPSKPVFSKKILTERIDKIQSPIKLRIDNNTKYTVEGYVKRGRKSTERILGRSFLYFPIFELYLNEYHLPESLKYLAIVESHLDPKAESHVGAVGLWQFMPATARKHGLKINEFIDERMDPHKSSEAAAKQLSYLYDRFGNWTLAIAAYNCGSTRMARSIKKAGSKKYQKVKAYLPKETVNYIKRFIAVSYVMNYYIFHDIHPRYPDYNLQITELIKVYKKQSLKNIAARRKVDIALLRKLNPSYLQGIAPYNIKGNIIILPSLKSGSKESVRTVKLSG